MDIFVPIETPRLRLRCVDMSDAALTSAMMTPAISMWLASWPTPFTHEMAEDRISRARAAAALGNCLPIALELKTASVLLGWISVDVSGSDRMRGSIGYWLGGEHHGFGYMREAIPFALAAGVRLLGLKTIEAGVQLGNEPSIALLHSCAMRFVGERFIHAAARGRDELCAFYEYSVSAAA